MCDHSAGAGSLVRAPLEAGGKRGPIYRVITSGATERAGRAGREC